MDAIIVLGAAVWADGPSPTLRRRVAHAAKLWHAQVAPLVIPCGGMGQHPPSEAFAMRTLLLEEGVNDNAIMLEDQSTTTLENIRNAKRLLQGKSVIIVTDRYHARRALMVARHFGLNARTSSPRDNNRHIRQQLREVIARPAYALRLWLGQRRI